MKSDDKAIIQKWYSDQSDLNITLAKAPDEMGDRMAQFCDKLASQIPTLKIRKESDEISFSPPAMVVGRHNNIAYQALPSGKILQFLLSTLETVTDVTPELDDALSAQLQQIDLPVALKLYVAPQCPHCPGILKQLLALTAANRHLRLTIIDAQQFEEVAQLDQVRSVPTLILDENIRWSGPMEMAEVLTICIQRDPTQLSAASVRQLIEDGQAQRVSQMMVDANALFPALVDLLTHERWSVRLGAMVTAEYLADGSAPLILNLATLLWDRLTHLSDPVKGDVLQVIGYSNCDTTRGYLANVLSGPFDETVKEAAADALEDMQSG